MGKLNQKHLLFFLNLFLFAISGVSSQNIDYPFYGRFPDKRLPSSDFQYSFRFQQKLEISKDIFSDGEPVFVRFSISCPTRDYSGKIEIYFKRLNAESEIKVLHKKNIGDTKIKHTKDESEITAIHNNAGDIIGINYNKEGQVISCNIENKKNDIGVIELKVHPNIRKSFEMEVRIWMKNESGDLINYPGYQFFHISYKWYKFIKNVKRGTRIRDSYSQIRSSMIENNGITKRDYNNILDRNRLSKWEINNWFKEGEELIINNPTAPIDLIEELKYLTQDIKEEINNIEDEILPDEIPQISPSTPSRNNYNPDDLKLKKYNPKHFNESRNIDTIHQKLLVN